MKSAREVKSLMSQATALATAAGYLELMNERGQAGVCRPAYGPAAARDRRHGGSVGQGGHER